MKLKPKINRYNTITGDFAHAGCDLSGHFDVKTPNFVTMKRIARPLAGYLMMFILFGVSTGFNLFTHICLMSGEQMVATQEETTDCCAKELPPVKTTVESNCCIEEVHFIKFDYTAAFQKYFEHEAVTTPVMGNIVPAPETPVMHAQASACNLPPPRTGNDLLAEISVFRI